MQIKGQNITIVQLLIATALAALIGASIARITPIYVWLLVAISCALSLFLVRAFFILLDRAAIIDDDEIEAIEPAANVQLAGPSTQPSELFGAAFDAISESIIILDKEQRILLANTSARKKYSTFAIGARVETLIRTQEILDALEIVVENKSRIEFDLIEHFPQLRYYHISISAFLVAGIYNYIIAILDETNLRSAEQMRADFLANVGHELRTPLAGISGFIETLNGPARDDEKARDKFLGIMQKQADRMGRLINDILSLTKIELNEHLKPKSVLNLVETLESMISTVKAANPDSMAEIIVHKSESAIFAIFDEDEIQQVLINILENAIKYRSKDTAIEVFVDSGIDKSEIPNLTIEKWKNSNHMRIVSIQTNLPIKYAIIRIENQGKGIEKRNMPRLSERFYRIETQSNEIAGTGLGLAIVKHIIARHDGILCVESIVGEKTAFSFGLPMPENE